MASSSSSSSSSLLTATTLTLFCILITLSSTTASNGGFRVELIHRDSPKSPFYNSQETSSERLAKNLKRSISRASHFSKNTFYSPNTPQSEIIANRGEYLMNISIGTPPFPILAIADTGSDLVWTQCKPCTDCYEQESPLFDPKSSSTYRDLSCSSTQCSVLEGTGCTESKLCEYEMSYGDRSHTQGNLAVDTVTLSSTNGRPVALPKTIIGCGHDNGGTFDKKGSGIIGLGGGSVSLTTQLGSSIDGKFSYCLVPLSSDSDQSSLINFGSNGVVSGSGVVSTPLVKKEPDTFYYLTLEAISVGSNKIPFPGGGSSFAEASEGNIIIDSGTTLTLLPREFYSEIESAVADAIGAERIDDPAQVLNLCYKATDDLKVPVLTVHFKDADVKLGSLNTFVRTSEEAVCFAFVAVDNLAIYGNLAQMNFLVGYDTEAQTVSFKPTDCIKA
ncbi:aspartic proteinase CDR1-like [Carica papaya]|uniref:aspartic proteinase CDR1-like n=1 Tax=Carica papaya TaxID=3649 RepID=UPI000B8CEE12|nr:aspartic proteinase CDR1-like [Carica papaya]